MCVFVPLNRVWHEFHKELGAVGAPLQAYVGEEISVSGLFSGISHALSRAGHAATHAIGRAASGVARTATNYAEHAAKFARGAVENKYFRDAVDVAAFAVPALALAARPPMEFSRTKRWRPITRACTRPPSSSRA